jgi:transposase-like protein
VYVWADGVYLQARLEPQAECMLVIIGATAEGRKELVGFQTGLRESAQSWRELLADVKARGLAVAPELAVGDGALGLWKALEEVFPSTRHQRCWVHKAANVLNKLPKSIHSQARRDLREIWLAPDKAGAEAATVRSKGALSQATARLMVFKLVMAAARTWRRLKGEKQLPKVIRGTRFENGVEVTNTEPKFAA